MNNPIRLAALQAQRAVSMAWTVGQEYQQPAHTFLAEKLPEATELHRQVVLPGAKRAVHLEALALFHNRGLSAQEIVNEVNSSMDAALAARLDQYETWRDGERADILRRAHEREERRKQLAIARVAEIQAKLDAEDRDAGN